MKSCNNICAVILCAGNSTRTGLNHNKTLHVIGQRTVIERVADAFCKTKTTALVLVVKSDEREEFEKLLRDCPLPVHYAIGGNTRSQSVRNGLKACALLNADIVVIHDGARAFVKAELIDECIDSAIKTGSGIAAIKTTDLIADTARNYTTLNRDFLFNLQTPQAFAFDKISEAYANFDGDCFDDSTVYAADGNAPVICESDASNVKVTTVSDLMRLPDNLRVGTGYDAHRLTEGRKLILCGIEVPYDLGLDGHSDADVPLHALIDALFSAAAKPDIGAHFPDNDKAYKNASSLALLKTAMKELTDDGYAIANVSITIIAQRPKLRNYIDAMRKTVADALNTNIENVGIGATTTENLGVVGEGQAIAATACALLKKVQQ